MGDLEEEKLAQENQTQDTVDGRAAELQGPFVKGVQHQETQRILVELEDFFRSQPLEWLPVAACANWLAIDLGYDDEDEFEDALGGSFADFVALLPQIETRSSETGTLELRVLEEKKGAPRTLTLRVTESSDLWRVLTKAEDASVRILELEFEISADGKRCVDALYQHLARAVTSLESHAAGLGAEAASAVQESIAKLRTLLDLDAPFTVVVEDPTGRSTLVPMDGVEEALTGLAAIAE